MKKKRKKPILSVTVEEEIINKINFLSDKEKINKSLLVGKILEIGLKNYEENNLKRSNIMYDTLKISIDEEKEKNKIMYDTIKKEIINLNSSIEESIKNNVKENKTLYDIIEKTKKVLTSEFNNGFNEIKKECTTQNEKCLSKCNETLKENDFINFKVENKSLIDNIRKEFISNNLSTNKMIKGILYVLDITQLREILKSHNIQSGKRNKEELIENIYNYFVK